MSLNRVHALLGNAFSYFALAIAVWGLFHLIRRREIGGDFWGAVAIGEGLAVLQALVGIVMLIQGLMPPRLLHFLYGALTALTWPAVFAFTRGDTGRRSVLAWTLASAALFGLALRAIVTGSVPH